MTHILVVGEQQQPAGVLMLTVTRPVSNFKCESYLRPETGTSFLQSDLQAKPAHLVQEHKPQAGGNVGQSEIEIHS